MDELKEWYKESLVARIQALEMLKKVYEEDGIKNLESVKRVAHSLKGSGTTYGFPNISAAAAILEDSGEQDIPEHLTNLIHVLKEVSKSTEKNQLKTGVLIVDDDSTITHMLHTKLSSKNREIFIAETATIAEEIVEAKQISLIILDLLLPDVDGRNFLVKLREKSRTASIPIFIISALNGAQVKTECFALGADDFFEKPLDPDTIAAAVASKIHQSGSILHSLHKDPLTNLLNRNAFSESFERASAYSKRSSESLAIAMIDLDHFKAINDSYGHAMGDEVLTRFSKVLTDTLRKSDIVSRWGGEEFVVLFPNTNEKNAKEALDKVGTTLFEESFKGPDPGHFKITFSAGIVSVKADSTIDDVVSFADQIMYKAKLAGRNRIFTSENAYKGYKIKVLIAEDDEYISRIIQHNLQREGFDVSLFKDGLSALVGAKKESFSLVILDVLMPLMDGFEVLKRLREIPEYRHVPIAILTAKHNKADIIKGIKLGASDYILKPFTPDQLTIRIWSLLRNYGTTSLR